MRLVQVGNSDVGLGSVPVEMSKSELGKSSFCGQLERIVRNKKIKCKSVSMATAVNHTPSPQFQKFKWTTIEAMHTLHVNNIGIFHIANWVANEWNFKMNATWVVSVTMAMLTGIFFTSFAYPLLKTPLFIIKLEFYS